MNAKLFISNIHYEATEDEVIALFSEKGEVVSFRMIRDRFSGRSKGFGFMEMGSTEQANAAIQQFNGVMWMERPLVVKEQREREERPGGRPPFRGGNERGGRPGGGGGYNNRYRDDQGAYAGSAHDDRGGW